MRRGEFKTTTHKDFREPCGKTLRHTVLEVIVEFKFGTHLNPDGSFEV
jgi:hypothetical protein